MRAVSSLVVCALCALGPFVTKSGPIGGRREDTYALESSMSTAISNSQRTTRTTEAMIRIADTWNAEETGSRQQQHANAEDESALEFWMDVQASDELDDVKSTEDGTSGADKSGDEQDFSSNPAPINEGRRRVGLLGVLGVITLTTLLGYGAYTRREHLKELILDLRQRLPPLPFSLDRLKYIRLPSLSIPTISAPQLQRTRRRRLRRPKSGFRPHSSRSRSRTNPEGLLYDYDYDGDYERGPGYGNDMSGSSSSSESYAHEAEAFDLGADEDFMIGAPRHSTLSPSDTSFNGNLRKGVSMSGVLGRWKRPGAGAKRAKGKRTSNAFANGNGGTVLFAVADEDLEMDLETNEALPLAPTPHRFSQGLGMLKGYGSAG